MGPKRSSLIYMTSARVPDISASGPDGVAVIEEDANSRK
jgi:hypothetical protein